MSLFVGLMSGTSADSVDAAVIEFSSARAFRLIATHREPLSPLIRREVLSLFANESIAPKTIGALDTRLGRLFAKAARKAISNAGLKPLAIDGIGSHGQTVYHAPNGRFPFTLQLGDPNIIAEITGITTVADFRRRDIAAGGQGAPLAPAFHACALSAESESRVILNLGGIANITVLPALSARKRPPILGFDTGPGNALLDAWVGRTLGKPMDADGAWSRSGSILPGLLKQLLAEPYFRLAPPKSTGREMFGIDWLTATLSKLARAPKPVDVAATLCELTAVSVARAIRRWAKGADAVFACGGGARNAYLMERLATHLAPVPITTTDTIGIPPAWMECMAFGWLAQRTLSGLSGNLPSVTGARRAVVLGSVHAGRLRTASARGI